MLTAYINATEDIAVQKKLLLLLFLTVKLYTYNSQGEESLNMYYF